ncbi:hypothetical protein R5A26_24765 [Streptomyces prunicolor]|uniref:Uncharacterized protein n=1 Tax=Streptomyces prunicolor TaxID=67348 RepID=A0ABU4FEY0_9ACTN|nr:hypothetical protein [Streptomyces prunicolor]MDV7219152.1 hypothetical protein [Streptomyces prunicolor]
MPVYCFLGLLDRDVRQLAAVVVTAVAEEVTVDVAVPVPGVLDDHAAAFTVLSAAGATEQRAFEFVMVGSPQFLGLRPPVGDILYAVKEVLGDQGFVAALVPLILVGDRAAVVIVAQDDGQPVGGDASFLGVSCVTGHTESALVQLVRQALHGVLAGGIEFERQPDERAAYRVDDHGADPAVFDKFDGVEVADRGSGDRATVLGLLPHFVLDVLGTLAGGVLVDDREHAVQHAPSWRVVDVLLDRRDQPDAELLQGGDHDRVVQPVPGEAAEHVDDDVAHVGVLT